MAVKAGAVAMPVAEVRAVTVAEPLKVPPAPLAGAVKVTVAPAIGALTEFVTVACNSVAKVVPTAALCGVPPVAVTEIVTGAVLVRLNSALDTSFATVATTM